MTQTATPTETDPKAIAATTRAAIRAATKTAGDPLHGLTISVRYRTASLMQEIDINVKGLTDTELILPKAQRHDGWATERAHRISDRLHQLAADALAWETGRHTFCTLSFDGTMMPAPACEASAFSARVTAGPPRVADAASA